MKKYIKKAKKKPFKRYSSSRVINVANDKEFSSKSYKKMKVTKKQQRLINKRFKGDIHHLKIELYIPIC